MLSKNTKIKQGYLSRKKGNLAETIACCFLVCKGYRILFRNFSCGRGTGRGEIDIIAKIKKTIVFIEVKYRSHIDRLPFSLTLDNKKRVYAAAEYFIGLHPSYKQYNLRFDVILFTKHFFPKHIKDAWRLNWQ